MMIKKITVLSLLALIPLHAFGAQPLFLDRKDIRLSPGSHPAAETLFVPSLDETAPPEAEPSWYQKSGGKKGLSGRAETALERYAAPDVAVLDRGFARSWQRILAGFEEPAVLVNPEEVAGLSATKPLLIIPSGALAGTAASAFFRAGLSHYVRSGGVLFCLAQKNGSDYASLPLAEGQRLEASGWSEDDGPWFKSAAIQGSHPLFAHVTKPVPALETEGYFSAIPAEARGLLVRPDGNSAIVVYPYGKGWVVASTLFTDFLALLGRIEPDEPAFLRGLLAWAKNPEKPALAPDNARPLPSGEGATRSGTGKHIPPLAVTARGERSGDLFTLFLEIAATRELIGQTVTVRAGGSEKTVPLASYPAMVEFPLSVPPSDSRVSFAVYNDKKRAVARGSLVVPQGEQKSVVLNRALYGPGDAAEIIFSGMGKGEISLAGLRFLDSVITTDRGSMLIEAPADLPAGSYPVTWKFEDVRSNKKTGTIWLDLAGYRAMIENVRVESGQNAGSSRHSATARFTIATTAKLSGKLTVTLKGPEGKTATVSESVLSLAEGVHTMPVTFSFSPDRAGIWELGYRLSTILAEGVGIPDTPAVLASGSSLFDTGDRAVLAVLPDKPFYYDPSGPVAVTIPIAGKGKAEIEIVLDDKQVAREQIELHPASPYRLSLPALDAGSHVIRAALSGGPLKSYTDQVLIYGLQLPDVALSLAAARPASGPEGPVLRLTATARNLGKSQAPAARIGLYEGDPAKGGKLITRLELPSLEAGSSRELSFDWPLTAKAGVSRVYARLDDEFRESDSGNNAAHAEVNIPDLLLILDRAKPSYGVDDPLIVPAVLYNLTRKNVKDVRLESRLEDIRKKIVSAERMTVKEIPAKGETRVQMKFASAYPPTGSYTLFAGLVKEKELARDSLELRILPGMMITAAIEGMPAAAVLCRPFAFSYRVKSTGSVVPASGTVRFEIFAAGRDKSVYEKQYPLSLGEQKVSVDANQFPAGIYRARLSASLINQRYQLRKELLLAEQSFSVSAPLEAARVSTAFPRVLVWFGRDARTVEQALTEKIIRQAFSEEDIYYKVVDTEQAFAAQAMTGMFNTYVLYEPAELPEKMDWLKDRVDQGQGLALIGSNEVLRSIGEYFGFAYEESPVKSQTAVIGFTGETMDLSGNIPVSGKMLLPRKKGATAAGFYGATGKPAVLADKGGKGRILLMPVSLSRSAFIAGDTGLYSLVLRKTAFFAAPDLDAPGGVAAGQLSYWSTKEPVKGRIREVLAPGANVLWTNAGGKPENNVITYDVKAEKEPKKLMYLYQPPASGKTEPLAETSYECNGGFVPQGGIK